LIVFDNLLCAACAGPECLPLKLVEVLSRFVSDYGPHGALVATSPASQLPIVCLMATLLKVAHAETACGEPAQSGQTGQTVALKRAAVAAEALDAGCLAAARRRWQQWQQLLPAALHPLQQVPVGIGTLQLQQGSPAWGRAAAGLHAQLAALRLVANMLDDIWEMGPAGALPDDVALQSGVIVEALAAAVAHLHGMLAAVAAAGSGGSSGDGGGASTFLTPAQLCWQEELLQDFGNCICQWAFICSQLPSLEPVPLPSVPACQAAAAAAEALLRLAPLLPGVPLVRPGGSNDCLVFHPPAGSPGVVVGGNGLVLDNVVATLLDNNPPEAMALFSMWQADWLVRSATPAAAPPANGTRATPAVATAEGGSGALWIAADSGQSGERLHSGQPVAAASAAALWLAALTAFKHRWAASQSPFADAAAVFSRFIVRHEHGDVCGASWVLVRDSCKAAVAALLDCIKEGVADSQRCVPILLWLLIDRCDVM
jgi:hypothetical protein